jgi:hypothetical protein
MDNEVGGTCKTDGRNLGIHVTFWLGNRKKRCDVGGLGVDGRIISKEVFEK